MSTFKFWFVLGTLSTILIACDPEVSPINEEENINEVHLTLTDPSGLAYHFNYKDSDGDGPLPANITYDTLPKLTELTGHIRLTNTLVNPAKDITQEVQDEAEDHQFFYQIDGKLPHQFSYLDKDSDQLPLGIQFKLTTDESASTKLKVILRHRPSKKADHVEHGDPTNAGGETDIDIDFPFIVR